MNLLEYLRLAQDYDSGKIPRHPSGMRLAIVTNFTDDLLKKALKGRCVAEGIHPDIYQAPFRQYRLELKDPESALARHHADITFICFEINPYLASEFTNDPGHAAEVLRDIRAFSQDRKGTFILHTFITPASVQHGRFLRDSALHTVIRSYARELDDLAKGSDNILSFDTDRLARAIGERQTYDLRGLYAFGQPFSNDFLSELSREWMAYVRSQSGRLRKCLVLDLDNTLWGGIVGETGPLDIVLGPDYPGNAFREFQRVIREYHRQGIILAINSRNNEKDVDEVFESNPHMILEKRHFAAIAANWKTKAENLLTIAEELNIGLDSMVFIDDDPVNRDLVANQLPEVFVPDWSIPPEDYARKLLDLDAFHSTKVTDEDRERGQMYAQERERKAVFASAPSIDGYLDSLGIGIAISINDRSQIPRLAQLTQKTNQFNLTTRRSTEQDLAGWMASGAFVYAGDVKDRFGPYGITIEAVIHPLGPDEAEIGTFLMSCRVMGRKVEHAFFRAIAGNLAARGITTLRAAFIPTKKNAPAADFLPSLGAQETARSRDGTVAYTLDLAGYLSRNPDSPVSIQITLLATNLPPRA